MKLVRYAVLTIALAAVAACGNDDSTGPNNNNLTVADLAGTYNVSSFKYVADANSSTVLDLAGLGMGITTLTVQSSGAFSGTLILPVNGTPQSLPISGTLSVSNTSSTGGDISIDFDAATEALGVIEDETGTFTYNSSSSTITMTLPNVTFDFTVSGATPVDANLTIIATKQ